MRPVPPSFRDAPTGSSITMGRSPRRTSGPSPWPVSRRGGARRLWDVGAGSGSVAIEWMLAHPANRAHAVERHPERAARIARNAAALGVPQLAVVEGRAPDMLAGLPRPDAVFIGGGATTDGVIEVCRRR